MGLRRRHEFPHITRYNDDMVRALVIRTAGTNCDAETCRAFSLAGAEPDLVHVNRLLAQPSSIDAYPIIALPGGFSYGDDVASGRILAMHIRSRLLDRLEAAAQRGALVIGICNGFQVLVQLGLLPGPRGNQRPRQTVSLTLNTRARFIDRWVPIELDPASPSVWTRELLGSPLLDRLIIPCAHAEGRLVAESPDELNRIEIESLAPMRYGLDLNGSERRIAALCDQTGHVLGLMPHPERFVDWNRHPSWTRLDPELIRDHAPPGLTIFRGAVHAARHAEKAWSAPVV